MQSSKRLLTEQAYATIAAPTSRNDGRVTRVSQMAKAELIRRLSSDLTAQLRGVGSRVRKRKFALMQKTRVLRVATLDVTEGYATNRYSRNSVPLTPYSSPAKPKPDSTHAGVIFRSTNDTLHDVFSGSRSGMSPTISPRKRERAGSDTELDAIDNDCDDKSDTEMEDNLGRVAPVGAIRSIRPLRRPRRGFLETRSLPAGALTFSNESMPVRSETEEDWSDALPAFEARSETPQA
jgi:hypothetical protein